MLRLVNSVVLLVALLGAGVIYADYAKNELRSGQYEATWPSLNRRPFPDWFEKAKLGFFLHIGVFSVPSLGSERFWYEWEGFKSDEYVQFMKKNYRPGFSYHEFANKFTAELFNASEILETLSNTVTEFVVVSAKHSDGYSLWHSKYSENWNSFDVGPRRDFLSELSQLVRSKYDMGFGVSYSLLEWFNQLYKEDQRLGFGTFNYVEHKVWPELMELVNTFEPDLLWMEGDHEASDVYWKSQEFLAYMFNSGPRKDRLITNDRWGNGSRCDRACFHTYTDLIIPGSTPSTSWVKEVNVDRNSRSHRLNAKPDDYLMTEEFITEFVTAAVYNATTVFHVGLSKYGTIQPVVADRLVEFGRWLTLYGHVFRGTVPWKVQKDPVAENVYYICNYHDIQGAKYVEIFAIILEYPTKGNTVTLGALKDVYNPNYRINLVTYGLVKSQVVPEGIMVELPLKSELEPRLKYAWVLQVKTTA